MQVLVLGLEETTKVSIKLMAQIKSNVQILSQTKINSTKEGHSSQATQHMRDKHSETSSSEVFINLT